MEGRLEKLIQKIKEYNSAADIVLIRKACEFAEIAHSGQKRASGEPYFNHAFATALNLAEMKMDSISIAAGFLHDTVEDAGVTGEELEKEFGKEIAFLVNGASKVSSLKLRGEKEEQFVENLRKMILVMAKDLRVIFIKLADRLHNMETLKYLSKEKQLRIARETLEVYAPLADRMQIGRLKSRLEDLAFPYVYSDDYRWLVDYSAPFLYKRERDLGRAIKTAKKELRKEGIDAEVHGRPKHLYSLWQKLLRPEIGKDITKIHDLVALRILADSVKDCYIALGIVHYLWKPVPHEGVSDFIAQPKPNGYRSIHTKVFGPNGRILEIQIRTRLMHEEAENGVAAHWFYADQKVKSGSDKMAQIGFFVSDKKLSWVKQLVDWQKEIVDSQDFLEALKFDALANRIFIFSPKGDVYDLPLGATPVDFAYAVHTQIGNEIDGAIVSGKMVSLSTKLKNGNVVEIINKKRSHPSEKWLEFVVTTAAKREILKYLRKKV